MKHIPKLQPRFSRHERLNKSIGRKACLIALLLAVPLSQVPAQQVPNPAASPADAKTVDYGESIVADGQVFNLKRIANQIVIKARTGAVRFDRDSTRIQGGKTLNRTQSLGTRTAIWQDDAVAADEPKRLQILLAAAKDDVDVEYAFPVYYVGESDFRFCATDELIVELNPDATSDALERLLKDYDLEYSRPVVATENTHVVRLARPKEYDLLTMVELLQRDADVLAARHNYLQEIRATANPSDPYFGSQQWHLANYASIGSGADQNANVKAPGAWANGLQYGSPGIVVAVLDNGIQTNHPELAANMLPGYDFLDGDADPNPSDPNPYDPDNHGTAVAGMIAAAVNGVGSVGGSPNCKILPIRMGYGSGWFASGDKIKAALVWAADRADVISCSWEMSPNTDVTAGFDYAANSGRRMADGTPKGTIAFCASGNRSKWFHVDTATIPAGNWRFRFTMKNHLTGGGGSTFARAYLAYVRFPDNNQTIWRLNEQVLPPGVTVTTPTLPWTVVDDLANAYGVGRYILRSPTYLPSGGDASIFWTSDMQISTAGKMRFEVFIDYLDGYSSIYVDGFKQNPNGSWPDPVNDAPTMGLYSSAGPTNTNIDPAVKYPASLLSVVAVGASTDWDYRSDFSCFGSGLALVAPGGRGYRDIFTTDRTIGGYDGFPGDTNFTYIHGTSFSAPLAASVAALVLSRNGNLSALQVRGILQNSAEKVHLIDGKLSYDPNGWNAFVGYGRVDASAAVGLVTGPTGDANAPTFTSASVQTTRSIDLAFSEPMGGAIYTPSSYTITGAGKGTLANNPSQVIRLTPSKYRLVWNAGGMVVGSVTIATTGLQDVAGNNLTGSTSTTSTGTKAVELVNCGGSTVFPFGSGDPRTPWLAEDTGWVGNTRMLYTTSGYGNYTMNSVNTSEVTSPAPTGVYQTARAMYYNTGWATYTLKNVLPNETVKVRLHFNEFYGWSNAGDQIFHIRINNSNPGTYPDLPNYDIMNYTGVQMNKADIREFTITNGSGPMVIQLEPAQGWTGYYNWTLNGIEVVRP